MSAIIKDTAIIAAPITKNLVLLLVIVCKGHSSHKNVLKNFEPKMLTRTIFKLA